MIGWVCVFIQSALARGAPSLTSRAENVETFFFLFWRKADDPACRSRRCSTDDAAAFVQLRPAEDSDRLIFYLEAMKPRIPEKWHARKLPGSGRTDALPFS